MDEDEDEGLLEGVPILPLAYAAERVGISVAQLQALIAGGFITDVLYGEDGEPLHLLEESVPSRLAVERMLGEMP